MRKLPSRLFFTFQDLKLGLGLGVVLEKEFAFGLNLRQSKKIEKISDEIVSFFI